MDGVKKGGCIIQNSTRFIMFYKAAIHTYTWLIKISQFTFQSIERYSVSLPLAL